jgi:hypothetical protein
MSSGVAIEKRIQGIETMLKEILGILTTGQPGSYSYDRALQQFARGDRKALEKYIQNGGRPKEVAE